MIRTARLALRRWREDDRAPFAALHADPEVIYWLGGAPVDRAQSDGYVERYESHFEAHGFGLWALERRADERLIGVAGLRRVDFDDHPMKGAVEIGWRLARDAWGQGYASEAAAAALQDGFQRVGLEEILSWTAASNRRSEAVMRRIGMTRDDGRDFDHPSVPVGHPLRPHIVYAARPPA